MSGSRKILVRKRDGGKEHFRALKLAGCIKRAMGEEGRYQIARDLAEAIETHLRRNRRFSVSSGALFRMALKVLCKVGMDTTAESLEVHRLWRSAQREALLVYHGSDKITLWDKTWLANYVRGAWQVSDATARVVASSVEMQLLTLSAGMVTRQQVLETMNTCVSQLGLAEAVRLEIHARLA